MILGATASIKIVKCHLSLAKSAFAGQQTGNSEEGCEQATTGKLGGKPSSLHAGGDCPQCVVHNTANLGNDIEAARDADNGDVFCAGTVPLGDDDTGFVPPDVNAYECEIVVAKNRYKFRYCVAKCHDEAAKYAFKGLPFDDDACETDDPLRSCLAKCNKTRDRYLSLCPPCLDTAAQDALAADAEADEDGDLGNFFCASPSGAFVD